MTKYTKEYFNDLEKRLNKCKTNDNTKLNIEESICNKIKNKIEKLTDLKNNLIDVNQNNNNEYQNNNNEYQNNMMFLMFFKILKEFEYQKNYSTYNEEYKELISGYSNAYLSGSDWYYGENLPEPGHFLSNKESICKLYLIFILFSFMKNNEKLSLLKNLGPEPLSDEFNNKSLYNSSIGKTRNIKAFIMDSNVVVGVGNIYASESLFLAGISPKRESGKTSRIRYQILTKCIKKILSDAINNGGTTLNDFSNVDGEPGYFAQVLSVYGRKDMPCIRCNGTIKKIVQNQRATYYCPRCQN